YGDCRKGNRPGYTDAASPEPGRRGYEQFVASLRAEGFPVETGTFGGDMQVALVNDGPVTLILESTGRDQA
ncbi:MAG: D-aminoacyl-tRNA deacylase, partial [Kiritimatiellae bacterium]|nr:D-aminoacyl-tRNA deacylase [Kiritimatiellia bacterium]